MTTTKAQNYQHAQRQALLSTFDDFCRWQTDRLRANTRDTVQKIRAARQEDADSPDARFVMTRRGVTTASLPVRREFVNQVSL